MLEDATPMVARMEKLLETVRGWSLRRWASVSTPTPVADMEIDDHLAIPPYSQPKLRRRHAASPSAPNPASAA
jgi:hypothetical protein